MKLSPKIIDVFFILPAIATIMMIADTPNDVPASPVLSQFAQAAILVAGTLVLGIALLFGSDLDRRCTEDYLFQLMANASLIAVGTCALVNMGWLLAMTVWTLPDLTGQNMTGITLLAFILGYYWFRWKGTSV